MTDQKLRERGVASGLKRHGLGPDLVVHRGRDGGDVGVELGRLAFDNEFDPAVVKVTDVPDHRVARRDPLASEPKADPLNAARIMDAATFHRHGQSASRADEGRRT
jgi:hypothetical protein